MSKDVGSKKCKPTCPYFKCGQKALFIRRPRHEQSPRGFKGEPESRPMAGIAWCNWVGDVCVGASCSYAFCEKRVLLPNGVCGLEERVTRPTVRSIEEEAKREEEVLRKAKEKVLKKIGSEYLE